MTAAVPNIRQPLDFVSWLSDHSEFHFAHVPVGILPIADGELDGTHLVDRAGPVLEGLDLVPPHVPEVLPEVLQGVHQDGHGFVGPDGRGEGAEVEEDVLSVRAEDETRTLLEIVGKPAAVSGMSQISHCDNTENYCTCVALT